MRAIKARFPECQDHPRHLQRLVRPAGGRARGAELGLPLPLHQGRARLRDRQHREAGALPVDPRGGAAAGRGPDLLARATIRSRRSPPTSATGKKTPAAREHAAARRAAGALHRRGLARRARRGPRRRSCAEAAPLDIINGPLMRGMDEVGRLFNANELIVAEVLQSAEAMKAAVAHLEPFMEKADGATRGQDRARDRQGRRPRHRQEPGRDHPRRTTATGSSTSASRCRPRS